MIKKYEDDDFIDLDFFKHSFFYEFEKINSFIKYENHF